jgi:hypothetical protein
MITSINATDNHTTTTMFILATIQSTPSLLKHDLKRSSLLYLTQTSLNFSDESIEKSLPLPIHNQSPTLDQPYDYSAFKDVTSKSNNRSIHLHVPYLS